MDFKLGIVIPLKAKKVSENWETVCHNLRHTINALENQSCNTLTWKVVGHDKPDYFETCNFKSGEFVFANESPIPDKKAFKGDELRWAYERDRCFKIDKGLRLLIDLNVSHYMALDADDILHRNFVKVLQEYKEYNAFLIDNGYMYFKDSDILIPNKELSAWCGSTCVIDSSLLGDDFITGEENSTSFFQQTSHCDYKTTLFNEKYKSKILQENLLIYVQGNGENISREDSTDNPTIKYLKKIKQKIKITLLRISNHEKILKDFIFN